MKRSTLFALVAVLFASIWARTLLFFSYSLWGIDCGEYVYYTHKWVSTGAIYKGIDGWAQAYPFFPGMFTVSGSLNLLTGTPLVPSVVVIPALISSFVPLFVFLLVYKVTSNEKTSLASAAFLTVLAPFVYNYSQPKPETVGFFLVLLLLLMSVHLSEKNKKYFWLMIPASGALIVTHHFSSYFLLLFLLGGLFVSIVVRGRITNGDRYRFYYFIFMSTAVLLYWLFAAPPFRHNRLYQALGAPSYSIVLSPYLFVVLIYLIYRFRKRYDLGLNINLRRENNVKGPVYLSVVITLTLISLVYLAFNPIPGRDIVIGEDVLLYVPLALLGIFPIFARKIFLIYRQGLHLLGWTVFIFLSFLAGVVTGSTSLLPMRQVAFIMLPVSILFGIGVVQYFTDLNPGRTRKKALVLSAVLLILLAWNLPLMYPTQEMANGYEERTEWDEFEACFWLKNLDKKVATEHRLSAAAFAVSNKNLSWTDGSDIYFSADPDAALEEMRELNVTFIMWDEEMQNGVTTGASEHPYPFSDILIDYYREQYLLYMGEETEVYIVER